jgi:glycosyltransferase involved in cell wall biosynthesis
MNTQPRISVVTVTYNAARWLEGTVLSVLNQSYPHLEYIIIDGASTDGTTDIIRQYEAGISYWASEPDNGLYDAMNKGIGQATGDYLWFINAGDKIETADTVQQMVARLRKRKSLPDIVYGETTVINEEGKSLGMRRLRPPKKLTWKSFRMGMLVCHQSFIIKREIAPLYNLRYRYSSDFDWCIRCMKAAKTICNSKMILSGFLDGGMSTVQRKASLKERYAIMCNYYGKVSTSLLHLWFAVRFYFSKWVRGRV